MTRRDRAASHERERRKREGVNARAYARMNHEGRDPWTGERVVFVNGRQTWPDWEAYCAAEDAYDLAASRAAWAAEADRRRIAP